MENSPYSPKEERINILSHLVGAIFALLGLILLINKAYQFKSWARAGVYLVYGLGMISMFLSSTLYHSAKDEKKRKQLRVYDHVSIYLMIAGSYGPFLIYGLGGSRANWLLLVTWLVAIAGMILKLFFTGRFKLLSTLSYVFLGCMVFFIGESLFQDMDIRVFNGLLAGGIAYLLGAILYQIKGLPFNHAIFHFFVLAGAFLHFETILMYL